MSILGAVGSSIGGLIGANAQKKEGQRNRDFQIKQNQEERAWSNEMFEKQNKRDTDFWNMQNAYNDPSAQMQRLKDAGLNPNLVYGTGADATAGPIATHSAPSPRTEAPRETGSAAMGGAISKSIFDFLNVEQAKANIARTNADTKQINASTASTEFDNAVKEKVGYHSFGDTKLFENEAKQAGSQKQLAEFEAWKAGSLTDGTNADKDSPVSKAIRAGYDTAVEKLKYQRELNDIAGAEKTITQYKANLAAQGIDPSTPWYMKIISKLLNDYAGGSTGTIAGAAAGLLQNTIKKR